MKKINSVYLASLVLLISLTTSLSLTAQESEHKTHFCGNDLMLSKAIERDPLLQEKIDQQDKSIYDFKKNVLNSKVYQGQVDKRSNGTANFTIPVVVYIVHGGGVENISDVQVLSQIAKLNDEFLGTGIDFCLATTEGSTPLGTGLYPGIIRHEDINLTNHNLDTEEALLKSISTLPSEKYLRIWVVKDITNNLSNSGTLGYSSFPTSAGGPLDGIVIRHDVFGESVGCLCPLLPNFDEGKILVHEVGHYLNLYHTFEDSCAGMTPSTCNLEGDLVCDTPPVMSNSTGNPLLGSVSSCITSVPALTNNHMEYTDDIARTSFTSEQTERMICAINLFRSNLVSTPNLMYTGINCNGGVFAVFSADTQGPCVGDQVTFDANSVQNNPTLPTYTWDFGDGSPAVTGDTIISHVYTTPGTHYATLTIFDGTHTVSTSMQIYVSACSPINSTQGNWYFYSSAGLNFASGAPTADDAAYNAGSIPSTFGSQGGQEACAVQSDNSGNLLFYTDAINVWDENHSLINSSTPLYGHQSHAQGTMILRDPGNSSEYYIFTTAGGKSNENNSIKGFRYSKVIVSGTAATMGSIVNAPVIAPAGINTGQNGAIFVNEGMTAIAACDGYWIICTGKSGNGPNTVVKLIVHKLDNTGLTFQSEFTVNTVSGSAHQFNSILEASPNGSKLVRGFYQTPFGTDIYDFDKNTGIISNETQLNLYRTYGASFSPNSQLLYTGSFNSGNSGLYQYDINASNITSTEKLVSSVQLNGIQTGPDGKIYCAKYNPQQPPLELAVIHQPNALLTTSNPNACLFDTNGPDLNTINSGTNIASAFGLPNMLDANSATVFPNTINYTVTNCLEFDFTADLCSSNYSWDFGDPSSGPSNNVSTLANPTHVFSSEGIYTVTLNADGTIITQTIQVGFTALVSGAITGCLENNGLFNYSTSGAPTGAIYNWTISTGGAIAGFTTASSVDVNWTSLPATLTLVVTDPATGCSDTVVKSVVEDCPNCEECELDPEINFTTNDNCIFDLTGINNGVVCPSQLYEWEIYDGLGTLVTTLSGQNLSYTFPTSDTYTVCLRIYVLNEEGKILCQDEVCIEIEAICESCDDCDLIPSTEYTSSDECTFDFVGLNSGTNCPSQLYEWEIYDGLGTLVTTLSGQNLSYTFPASGIFTVCMTIYVLNDEGKILCQEGICTEIEATCESCDDCDLDPEINIISSDSCTFDLNGINNGTVCPNQLYTWEIYDNLGTVISTLSGQNLTYTFPASGFYTACLTLYVLNEEGKIKCKEQICKKIEVNCQPCEECNLKPKISIQTSDKCTFDFSGINNGTDCPSQLYKWEIYNSAGTLINTLSGQNLTYTFPSSGSYAVCMTIYVLDIDGTVKCEKQKCKKVQVQCELCDECDLIPKLSFNTSDNCTYQLTGINNGTVCPSQLYLWEIYNSSGGLIANLSGQNLTYTFPTSGQFAVCMTLYVLNEEGKLLCEKHKCKKIMANCDSPIKSNEKLNVWPNPSNDGVYFLSVSQEDFESSQLRIYDALGVEVPFIRNNEGESPFIELQTDQPGVYFLILQNGDQIMKTKLVKY